MELQGLENKMQQKEDDHYDMVDETGNGIVLSQLRFHNDYSNAYFTCSKNSTHLSVCFHVNSPYYILSLQLSMHERTMMKYYMPQ